MKFNTLIVIVMAASLTLAACGATAATTSAPASDYGNSTNPTIVPPTIAPESDYYGYSSDPTSTPVVNSPVPAQAGFEAKVQISGHAFNPNTLEVKIGTTVTWKNEDSVAHIVVADDGSFTSKILGQGDSFSFTFSKAGTYSYHCDIHSNMKATITVMP